MLDVDVNGNNGLTIAEYLKKSGHKEIDRLFRYAHQVKARHSFYIIKRELRKHQKFLNALIAATYICDDNQIETIPSYDFAVLLKDYLRIKEFLRSKVNA